MPVEYIGRVLFEDENGHPRFTADWKLPLALRTLEVITEDGVFAAHRQLPSGQWVYRKTQPRQNRRVDDYVADVRFPGDDNYDGPAPKTPVPPVWKDVQFAFETLVNDAARTKGKIDAKKVVELLKLTHAAFHRLPYTKPETK